MDQPDAPRTGDSPWLHNAVLAAFFAIAAFYLYAEHRAYLLGALPWLLLLACPLMHSFMHRGHGHHRHGGDDRSAAGDKRDR